MSIYEAEIGPGSEVLRVIVSPAEGWGSGNLGGEWRVTSDPYTTDEQVVAYAGIGHGFDPGVVEQFVADHWTNEKATIPDPDTGEYFYNTQGMLTWYDGKAWRNTLPTGSPNTWEPGVANWREYPLGDEYPLWLQPSGAYDAYPYGFTVEHNEEVWVSNVDANVWEPGAAGITQWDTP